MGRLRRRFYVLLTVVSALSFVGFGIGYMGSPRMRGEFTRFRLPQYRVLAAWLQVVGGAAQLIGLRFPPIGVVASAGLAAMMAVAIAVRIRIGDPVLHMLPAAAYVLLCVYLAQAAFRRSRSPHG